MQTDPVGYDDGINWYLYCKNNPLNLSDPSGNWADYDHEWVEFNGEKMLQILCLNEDGSIGTDFYFNDWDDAYDYVWNEDNPGDFCDVSFDLDAWESWAH